MLYKDFIPKIRELYNRMKNQSGYPMTLPKHIKKIAENNKISIRNIRRDQNNTIKQLSL